MVLNISNDNRQTVVSMNREEIEKLHKVVGNRVIDNDHVKSLLHEMETSLKNFPPIVVNSVTNNIIDGQHRAEAFKRGVDDKKLDSSSTLLVQFITIPIEKEWEAVINANTHSKSWQLCNFIEGFSEMRSNTSVNSESYQILMDWCRSHPLAYANKLKSKDPSKNRKTYKYRFGYACMTGKNGQTDLKSGTINLTPEHAAFGDVIHGELVDIISPKGLDVECKPSALEYLAIKWIKVRSLHPFNEWLGFMKADKKSIKNKFVFNNAKDWEQIFNYIHTNIDIKNAKK